LAQRVDVKKVAAMIAASAEPEEAESRVGQASPSERRPTMSDDDAALKAEPLADECLIDDFTKIDLRVCRVLSAEEIPEAKKLLKLTISLGGDNTRTVFAGIKAYYKPEQLIGKLFICIANLAPRKMKFGLSEGMMLAAGGEGDCHLLIPDEGAKPGQRVH
jgi:methionyl-tRNA synthetase